MLGSAVVLRWHVGHTILILVLFLILLILVVLVLVLVLVSNLVHIVLL